MKQVNTPAATVTPTAPNILVTPPAYSGVPPQQPKKPQISMIIERVVVLIVIIAVVYFVGMPMLKGTPKSPDGFAQS